MQHSISSWAEALTEDNLNKWLANYTITEESNKNIGIILAGNIPLVGFHDFLSVLITGNNVLVKTSSNDQHLIKFLAKYLISIDNRLQNKITFVEGKLEGFDAVIATGSNNTSRYFEYYFKKKPSIIRKNRNSVAVLNGKETTEDLIALGEDIFRYFGLGCRNVSKLYIPKNYNFDLFFNSIFCYKELINNHKYANNYDYNKAIYLMSEYKFLDNGFFIVKEGNEMHSPISTINFEYYDNVSILKEKIYLEDDNIQCIVSNIEFKGKVNFGETQNPSLNQYADNIDVMRFLLTI